MADTTTEGDLSTTPAFDTQSESATSLLDEQAPASLDHSTAIGEDSLVDTSVQHDADAVGDKQDESLITSEQAPVEVSPLRTPAEPRRDASTTNEGPTPSDEPVVPQTTSAGMPKLGHRKTPSVSSTTASNTTAASTNKFPLRKPMTAGTTRPSTGGVRSSLLPSGGSTTSSSRTSLAGPGRPTGIVSTAKPGLGRPATTAPTSASSGSVPSRTTVSGSSRINRTSTVPGTTAPTSLTRPRVAASASSAARISTASATASTASGTRPAVGASRLARPSSANAGSATTRPIAGATGPTKPVATTRATSTTSLRTTTGARAGSSTSMSRSSSQQDAESAKKLQEATDSLMETRTRADAAEQRVQDLELQLGQTKEEVQRLLSDAKERDEVAASDATDSQSQIDSLKSAIATLEIQVRQSQEASDALRKELEDARKFSEEQTLLHRQALQNERTQVESDHKETSQVLKDKISALETQLSQAQSQHETALQQATEQANLDHGAIVKAKDELEAKVRELEQRHTTTADTHASSLTDLETRHSQSVEQLRGGHVAELDGVRSEHASELEKVRAEHAEALEALKQAHASDMERSRTEAGQASSAELDEMRAKLSQHDNDLQQSKLTAQQERDAALENLRNEHSIALAQAAAAARHELDTEYESSRTKSDDERRELEAKVVEATAELEKLRADLAEAKDAEARHAQSIATASSSNDDAIAQAREQVQAELTSTHKRELQALREEVESSLAQLKTTHEAEMNALKEAHVSEMTLSRQEMENRIATLSAELEASRAVVVESKATVTKLEEAAQESTNQVKAVQDAMASLQDQNIGDAAATTSYSAEDPDDSKVDVTGLQAQLEDARTELAELQEAFKSSQEAFAAQLDAMSSMSEANLDALKADHDKSLSSLRKDVVAAEERASAAEQSALSKSTGRSFISPFSSPAKASNGFTAAAATDDKLAELHEAHSAKLSQVETEYKGQIATLQARTAVPVWSPSNAGRHGTSSSSSSLPLLATGTVSGALDASFSSDSVLELWSPFGSTSSNDDAGPVELQQPLAALPAPSRFNTLAWGYVRQPDRPRGVLAAGFENGEIALWNPDTILNGQRQDPLIARYDLHKGPVRGLDFNQHQINLLASGATNGEIFVWDLNTPNKPFSPGARSRSLDDVTCLAWNAHVVHVLATSSNSGYTVVWDLKSKREVTALSYSAGGPTGVGTGFGQPGWGPSGSRGASAVQWHPDNPTKLVTATDDDHNPVIMLWDLRNWKEPEKVMTGHEKGILSLSWCTQDADLLLSSGKDGRSIVWNPSLGEIVAEVTPSSNWAFDAQWCPKNPSIIATAGLDGKIAIQSVQSTATPLSEPAPLQTSLAPGVDGANIFEAAISANAANYPTKSLTHAPKWLRRPASVAFGFGGKLVSVSSTSSQTPGAPSTSQVSIGKVVAAPEVVQRAQRLDEATASGSLATFCEQRSSEIEQSNDLPKDIRQGEVSSWKLLGSMFGAQSKAELVESLGFSKSDTKAKVIETVKSLRGKLPGASDDATSASREPLVTFADTPTDGLSASSAGEGAAAAFNGRAGSNFGDESVTSTSIASEGTKIGGASEIDSEVTEPSLFGDDNTNVPTPSLQSQAAADFYSQIGSGRPAALPDHVFGRDAGANSSVAATIGSSSSVASLNLRASTFKIYRDEETDVDRLITRALVLGDFESAVALALSTDRHADAILFAVRGGPDLLARTQKMYFERQTESSPYLRVLQSIVGNDLADIVQNANLSEWQEIFVVLCTYASVEEFPSLAEQLGQRLEYQHDELRSGFSSSNASSETRKNATLCYLAAGKLEKVVGIWLQQMNEDEDATQQKDSSASGGAVLATNKYDAHAKALQTFIEKVSVFQQAVGYVDTDLTQPSSEVTESGARAYKLAELYERYVEYADLLASQGLVDIALKYIAQTPADFQGRDAKSGPALTRERLLRASASGSYGYSNMSYGSTASQSWGSSTPAATSTSAYGSNQYQAYASSTSAYTAPSTYQQSSTYGSSQPYQSTQSSIYSPPAQNALDDPYAPVGGASSYGPPSSSTTQANGSPYGGYGAQSSTYNNAPDPYGTASASNAFVPPPPAIRESSPNFAGRLPPPSAVPPPPRHKPDVQWNDAPILQRKVTPAAGAPSKTQAITSPFPSVSGPGSPTPPQVGYNQPGQAVPPPPPSRGANRTPAPPPPSRFQPPPPQSNTSSSGQAPSTSMGPPPPPTSSASAAPPQSAHNPYAPPPPTATMSNNAQGSSMPPPPPPGQGNRFPMPAGGPPPPPPMAGQPRPPQQQGPPASMGGAAGGLFRGAPTPPPGQMRPTSAAGNRGPYAPPPPPAGPGAPRPNGAAAGLPASGPPQPPAPQQQPPSGPYAPPTAALNPGPYAPPPGSVQQRPGPPGGQMPPPPSGFGNASQAGAPASNAPAPPPPRPEPPKSKYPPGDRSHIPAASKPIVNTLTAQLDALKSLPPGPPQQMKMIQDTEKRINVLFDMLNCETLTPASTNRLLEVCKAIDARNKQQALDLHLQMITSGATDVGSFQAAVKFLIQRMQ
ncbi:protein transport protein S31 [Microbotryomycetes sp. JL221]|nr:protein transport protein S31 [Microbotryomycetes sp. JL221]